MNVLGLMSGSSLDGLDMALCKFNSSPSGLIEYEILETRQLEFPYEVSKRLASAVNLSGKELMLLEGDFSSLLGKWCAHFIEHSKHSIDLIASHGHTIFHFPEQKVTTQIGNGGVISQIAKCSVVCDFRSSDLGAGGLGAPCAPIADKLLFHNADIFINIGGISNLTSIVDGDLKAFDISPANQLLNYLASLLGETYDVDGRIASRGKANENLLENLLKANSFNDSQPRALDNTWVKDHFIPILQGFNIDDAMRTVVDFICLEIRKAIEFLDLDQIQLKVMITGGGALNKFLMKRLNFVLHSANCEIIEISPELINYKEALLIALMAYLRVNKIPNVLKEVTGASRNTIGGCIYEY